MINKKPMIAIFLGMAVLTGCTESPTRQIQVSATAQVKAKPEVVVFDFQIEERGKVLRPLKATVDRRTASLVALCKKLGIKPRDLTAAEVSIQPQYDYRTDHFNGYQVSRTVTARLYDLTRYSKVIDGAVNAGITTINNVSLQLKDDNELELKALAKAVEKATTKAGLLATRNGVGLGKVIQVVESGPDYFQSAYELKKSARISDTATEAAPNAFEPGRLSVSKTVQITFAIN